MLAAEAAGTPAVLLGWSYGGIVISDYLTAHGTDAVAGVIYTGSMANIGVDVPGAEMGSALRQAIPGVFDESPGKAVRGFMAFGNANTGEGTDKGVDAQRLFGSPRPCRRPAPRSGRAPSTACSSRIEPGSWPKSASSSTGCSPRATLCDSGHSPGGGAIERGSGRALWMV
ncbi:Uncharacterised protein [Mycobacteroides abscessus subsp. abscessus]|nr:Uncharacterised protein [Mycobacteroides abscessus subsp. abscessus]